MSLRNRAVILAVGSVFIVGLTGCASHEMATVSFNYVVEPEKGLPPGMETLIIVPAKIGPTTDEKWSDMSATILQSLVNESRERFGTDIEVSDRRDTQITFDEADLAASGMSDRQGGGGGQLQAAEGAILSNINVKVEKHKGKQRTLSGFSAWGGGGHGWGHGGGSARTEEVDTVTRNMTVQTEFKLLDTSNNKVWTHYLPKTYRSTEKTEASPIFGSSQTEAELTPEDAIIATLIERGAREFVSKLMTCRIDVEAVVESSGNENCVQGVKMLRAESYDSALASFKLALTENPNDHRAAYGAAIACEASGKFDDAMKYYKQALVGANNREYKEGLERMKTYGNRARS